MHGESLILVIIIRMGHDTTHWKTSSVIYDKRSTEISVGTRQGTIDDTVYFGALYYLLFNDRIESDLTTRRNFYFIPRIQFKSVGSHILLFKRTISVIT